MDKSTLDDIFKRTPKHRDQARPNGGPRQKAEKRNKGVAAHWSRRMLRSTGAAPAR